MKERKIKRRKEILFISTHKPFIDMKSSDYQISNYEFFKNR